jgi:hypothetical protein
MDDLTPAWTADGSYSLASVSMNVRKKLGGMKFMRHT